MRPAEVASPLAAPQDSSAPEEVSKKEFCSSDPSIAWLLLQKRSARVVRVHTERNLVFVRRFMAD